MKLLAILMTALFCCEFATSLRILGVFPMHARSHWVIAEKLMTELAKRGHRVDVITHFPRKKPIPNYKDISLEGTMEKVVNNLNASTLDELNAQDMRNMMKKLGTETCDLLALPQLQELIHNPPRDPPYDLIIEELFFSPCYVAFARHLNVPMIGMTTSDLFDWIRDDLGNSQNPSYVPSIFASYDQHMNFWQRTINTLMSYSVSWQVKYYTREQEDYVKKYFGVDDTIEGLYRNVAAVFINTHHSMNVIKPLTQGIIEVGGLHVSEDGDPLTPELKKWLDESTNGCILFTFGSMMRIETFPKPLVETFYKVFEKIAPVRVLMKVARKEDLLPGLPKNVMIQSWFPQVSVFKHKNTKAFITHGGLMSKIEAIHFGVPMIGIPLFGDQPTNMKSAANKKIAVTLESINNVTEETLSYAINSVLYDDVYRTNIKRMSELFKDRPMKPIDTAIFWVEYIARNGNILRSPALDLTWWQLNLLDVYGLFAAIILVVILVLRKLVKLVISALSRSTKTSKPESKKRK